MKQKDEERLIMDYFRRSYPDFPKGKLKKSESPDFILQHNHHAIGIEITRLHEANLPKNNPGFPVAEFTYQNVMTTIWNKEPKLLLYQKKKIGIFWLIISTDYILLPEPDSPFDLKDWTFETGFHKVFLFDLFGKNIHEVMISGKPEN